MDRWFGYSGRWNSRLTHYSVFLHNNETGVLRAANRRGWLKKLFYNNLEIFCEKYLNVVSFAKFISNEL